MRLVLSSLGLVLLLACSAPVAAADIEVQPVLSVDSLRPGSEFGLAVVLTIPKPWHVNANPASEGLIATELHIDAPEWIQVDAIEYSPGENVKLDWSEEPVALYSGEVTIRARARIRPTAAAGPVTISGMVRYQACNDEICVAPVDVPVTWTTTLTTDPNPPRPMHPHLFTAAATPRQIEATTAVARADTRDDKVESLIERRGWALALVVVFLGGLALNLTPCVYPMIAITVSYFGGQGPRKFSTALLHSLIYCLGIVLTYSTLGVVAAMTSGLFGGLLQSPAVLIGIAVLMILLALSMFGLYELRPPSFLVQRAAGMSSRAGFVGVFLLGATVGIIAAPCLAPILVALLAYVGQRGDPVIGWWLFFTLALGLGAPYVILGTFSGLINHLPKSGTWMVWVKRVFGVLLIGVALWFVAPLFRAGTAADSPIDWKPYAAEAVVHSTKPVLIDFYADWCIPCREMDATTLRDARVVELSRQFLMLKADLTQANAATEQLTKQFDIVGVPTYLFLAPAGGEHRELRQVGYVKADAFVKTMERAINAPQTNEPSADASPAQSRLRDIPPQLMNPF